MSHARMKNEKNTIIAEEMAFALNQFVEIHTQPLREIIERIYSHDPKAIHEFCIRMSDPTTEDLEAAIKKRKELYEKKLIPVSNTDDATFCNVLDRSFLESSLALDITNQIRARLLLSAAKKYYNNLDDEFASDSILQSDDAFYRDYFYLSALDPWNIHTLINDKLISDHFIPQSRHYIYKNPNRLYLIGLSGELSQNGIVSPLFKPRWNRRGIDFPPFDSVDYNSSNKINVYTCYLNALTSGLAIALTGIARLFAQGSHGLWKDIHGAVLLYQMAMRCGVYGAMPLNSNNPKILYYSTMLSGMNRSDRDSFLKLSKRSSASTLKTYWMIRMNYANPTVQDTLKRFETLAIENPNNMFDSLLDEDIDSMSRLKYCVSSDLYEHILRRKKRFFQTYSEILEKKVPFELSKYILSFISGSEEFLKELNPKIPDINIKKMFSCQSAFFNKLQETFLVENRHKDDSGKIQHEYDKRFGLIKK